MAFCMPVTWTLPMSVRSREARKKMTESMGRIQTSIFQRSLRMTFLSWSLRSAVAIGLTRAKPSTLSRLGCEDESMASSMQSGGVIFTSMLTDDLEEEIS
jgi:hypothetical protein